MPFRQLPRTDEECTKALDALHKRWVDLAAEPAKRLITATHFANLDEANPNSLRRVWKKEIGEASAALATQINRTQGPAGVGAKFARAAELINHYFIVLDLAIQRAEIPAGHRTLYSRDANATTIPLVTQHADIPLWSGRIAVGEAARLAAGAAPMAMPSAAQIAAAATEFASAIGLQNEAQSDASDEARDVADQREAVLNLIRSAWNTIEFNLTETGLGPAAMRAEARLWGVIYIPRPGDAPEDGPGNPPVPPPPPPPPPPPEP